MKTKNETLSNRTLLGPWKVQKAKDTQSRLAIIRDVQGYGVAEMFTRGTEQEQNQVATLIAAAPEMFEALEYAQECLEKGIKSDDFLWQLDALIKKARGE